MAKVLGFSINIQGLDTSVSNAEELRRAIAAVNKAIRETNDGKEYERLEKQLIDLKARQGEVNAQIREEIKQRRAELKATDDTVGAYRALSNQLNAARSRYKDLAVAGRENTEEAKALIVQIIALDKRLKEVDASVGQFQRSVGDYRGAIADSIPFLGQFSRGLEDIRGATTRTGKALAAGVLTGVIIQGIIEATRAVKEFADEYRALAVEVNRQTGAIGDDLQQASARVTAIAKTYNQSTDEIIRAANALTREFGISLTDALDRVAVGFREGADNGREFLDSIREYSTQFRAAGASADEFLNVLIRQGQEGIFSDKGVDAVKEFGLRIREQTTATRSALENAFGQQFTDQLFNNLNRGAITTIDALRQVSDRLNDAGLTAQQTQRVIADVFGGPGEDAGLRYLQLLKDIDDELDTAVDVTNAYKVQQEELYQANLALSEAQAEVATALQDSSVEIDLLTTRVKTFLFEQAALLLRFFNELPATLAGVGAAFKQLGLNILATLNPSLAGARGNVLEAYNKAFLEGLKRVRDNDEAGRVADEIGKRTGGRIAEATGKSVGERTGKAVDQALAGSIAAIEKRKSEIEKAIQNAVAGSARQSQLAGELRNVEAELERAIEARNRAVLGAERRAEVERLLLISNLGTKAVETIGDIEDKKTQVVLDKVRQRANVVTEELRKQREAESAALAEGIRALEDTLSNELFNVIGAFNQRTAEATDERFQQIIEATEERISATEDLATRASGVYRRELLRQVEDQKAALAQQNAQREKAQRDLAKKEKALAIIQTIIQTALAVSRALANPPGPPFSIPQAIAAGIQGAAQTALIAAQPLATGGIVGRTVQGEPIRTLRNGDNVLTTLRRGEVVLNARQQAILGGAATFRAAGVPGFAAGGAIGAPISAPRVAIPSQTELLNEIRGLRQDVTTQTAATNARIDRLRAFVVSEDVADDLEEGDAIRINATLQ